MVRRNTPFFTTLLLCFACVLLTGLPDAKAVPAFARETGLECAACHVGSFGPQLTAVGRNFKLSGYMISPGEDNRQSLKDYLQAFSGMAFGGFEHTGGDLRRGTELTGPQARLHTNDNLTLDQASLFYGGQVAGNVGMLAQATYSQPNQHFAWDNTDIRYASSTQIGDKSLLWGVTANNNPTVEDIWNSTPAWGFPYLSSALLQTPTAAPYITSLGGTVGGAGLYGLWNDLVYAEVTGYATLPGREQLSLGESNSSHNDHLRGIAPYWRVALQHDFGAHYVELGTYGIAAERYPGNVRDFGTDRFVDYAVDASYQFTTGKHSISAYASALREHATLSASAASGGSSNPSGNLTALRGNVSYYYNNTYGLTLGSFSTTGSADATLYANPSGNKPDSSGWTVQADYTPFGTSDSFAYPNLNMRFFVQYTAYWKFNGLSGNYDGTGRNASDNNLLFAGVWFAF